VLKGLLTGEPAVANPQLVQAQGSKGGKLSLQVRIGGIVLGHEDLVRAAANTAATETSPG
jgi:hypothetical protein